MINPDSRDQLDLLLHIERLTEALNRQMNSRSRVLLKRYPLTFGLVALFAVVAVSEGIKGILEQLNLFQSPWQLLAIGLFILLVLGSVYKKINKG